MKFLLSLVVALFLPIALSAQSSNLSQGSLDANSIGNTQAPTPQSTSPNSLNKVNPFELPTAPQVESIPTNPLPLSPNDAVVPQNLPLSPNDAVVPQNLPLSPTSKTPDLLLPTQNQQRPDSSTDGSARPPVTGSPITNQLPLSPEVIQPAKTGPPSTNATQNIHPFFGEVIVSPQQVTTQQGQSGRQTVEARQNAQEVVKDSPQDDFLPSRDEANDQESNSIVTDNDRRAPSKPVQSSIEKALQPTFTTGLYNNFSVKHTLEQFGYDQFKADRFEFDPIANAAAPEDYKLGPGDEVILHQSLSNGAPITLIVDQNGMLPIPKSRPLSVWNLTLKEVTQKVQKLDKFTEISLGKLRSIQINLIGEASSPGLHQVPATASVYNILALVGGVEKSGSLRRIQWKRGKRLIAEIDLYDYLLWGKSLKNVHMKSGDTLFIPLLEDVVAVVGQVRRPAIFELKKEDDLKEVLNLAGGLLPTANTNRILVERIQPNEGKTLQTLSVSLKQSAKQKILSFDTIKVFSIPETHSQFFTLIGPFTNQGKFEFQPGLTLKEALAIGGKLTRQSSLQGHIERQLYKTNTLPESQFILFNLKEVLENRNMHQFLLKDSDIIQVYPEQNYIFVQGAISKPGRYPYLPGLTLADLLTQAQGMRSDAYQERIDIQRKFLNENNQLITNLLQLNPGNPQDLQTPLSPNDVVIIHDNTERFETITVRGQIKRPGQYSYFAGMTLKDALFFSKGFANQAFLERIDIQRNQVGKPSRVISVQLNQPDAFDTPLEADDIILVYNNSTRLERITLEGAVEEPGVYPFYQDMTLKDALFLAGRLATNAYRGKIDIQRVSLGETLRTITVYLDAPGALETLLQSDDKIIVYEQSQQLDSITVEGEVKQPGPYQFSNGMSLRDALFLAQGMKSNAYQSRIDIRRVILGEETQVIPVLLDTPQALDTELAINDTIIVYDQTQQFDTISVGGEVKTPGEFPFSQGMAIKDALFLAKGLNSTAIRGRLSIQRISFNEEPQVIMLPLDSLQTLETLLQPNDTITVYGEFFESITVQGEVKNPGTFPFAQGMTLKDALFIAGDLTPNAHRGRIDIRRISLGEAPKILSIPLNAPRSLETLLKIDDEIIIYDKTQQFDSITVAGEVKAPGDYPYFVGMTLDDAIFQGKGLKLNAHRGRIDIYRNIIGEPNRTISVLLGQPQALNTLLAPNDRIQIYDQSQQFEQITVNGEINSPGSFPYSPGMTLRDAIFLGKGLNSNSFRERVTIRRVTLGENPKILTVFLDRSRALETPLQPDDVILFHHNDDVSRNISIRGEVERPGIYPFLEGMTIEDALFLAKGLNGDAYKGRLDIKRVKPKSEIPELIRILLSDPEALQTPLKLDDELIIYDRSQSLSSIIIRGEVRTPGTFPYFLGMTVDDAIFLANGFTPTAFQEKIDLQRQKSDGKRGLIDIPLQLGKSNFLLEPNDLLIVHPSDIIAQRQVTILGPIVQRPGLYPFIEGMTVKSLIFSAGGLKNKALDPNITVKRWLNEDGQLSRQTFTLKINPRTLETTLNLILEEEDLVILRQLPEYNLSQQVTISGEVVYPGTYEVTKGDRISDLIKMAGGYTDKAFLAGATLTRQLLKTKEDSIDKRIQKDTARSVLQTTLEAPANIADSTASLSAVAAAQATLTQEAQAQEALQAQEVQTRPSNQNPRTLTQEQSTQLVQSKEEAKIEDRNIGRLIVNLTPLATFEGSKGDIELLNGDTLTIPPILNSVLVKGEAYGEASLLIRDKATAYYYLEKLGGPRELASLEEVYVLRGDGSVVQRDLDQYEIQGGDTIIIPPDLSPRESTLKNTASIVDVVFKTLTTLALIVALL